MRSFFQTGRLKSFLEACSQTKFRLGGLATAGILISLFPIQGSAAAATQTRTASFVYDAASGLVTKEIVEPDTSTLCLVTAYGYDLFGNKNSSTTRNCNGTAGEAAAPTGDPLIASRTTGTAYDAQGRFPTSATNALSQGENRVFDSATGALLSLTGPNGLTTSWQYDGFGRKTLELRADGTSTKWEYLYCTGVNGGTANCPIIGGATGAWLSTEILLASDGVTQSGPINKTYYDTLNREIRSETQGYDGGGSSVAIYKDTQYDSLGRPYMVSRPYYGGQTAYWTVTAYDNLGRVIQETQPDNSVTSTAYNGLVTTVTNAKSQITVTTRNAQGQVVRVVDALNNALIFAYDPFGNLQTTTDPSGNSVTLTYDLRGRKIQMKDPDMGTWTYVYDVLGEMVRQTDGNAQITTLTYDLLGRLTKRAEPDLVSTWYYDAYKGGTVCTKGIGKLCQSETSTGYNRTVSYDLFGRQVSTATTIDSVYTASATFDSNSRINTRTFPSGLGVKYVYTGLGYLKEVRDNNSNALYWQANNLDAEGHFLQQIHGNGVATQKTFDSSTGRISSIVAGAGNAVSNLSYQYDVLGNVVTRNDSNQALAESFVYDSLNRMTSGTINSSGAGIVTTAFSYDSLGNLTSKGDLGSYIYPASGATSVRPHAVSQVNLTGGGKITFAYDAKGALLTQTQTDAQNNTVAAKSRSHSYTSFGMPQALSQGAATTTFAYGPEHQRVRLVSSVQGTTVYVNPDNEGALFYEKDTRPDNSVEQRSFITAGGEVVAVVKHTTVGGTTTASVRYFHRDNLGSMTAVTNESGVVVEPLAYEPFGKRRFANGSSDPNNAIQPVSTDRGFTGHEMLDEIGLVHMNGRIFDPMVARFASADPLLQFPMNLQGYNRYSYLFNNPLAGTDPSGYKIHWSSIRRALRVVVAAVVVWYTGYYYDPTAGYGLFGATSTGVSGGAAAFGNAVVGGFAAGSIVSGNLQGGLQGAATAGLFWGAGSIAEAYGLGEGSIGKVGLHAAAGCASSSAFGGKCSQGAMSAAFAEAAGPYVKFDSAVGEMVARMVVGGTVSELGGGKFANGAYAAAFGYLFNEGMHPNKSLAEGYMARVDRFNYGGEASYEIHVINTDGIEVGVYGPNGWINKHGGNIPELSNNVQNSLKGLAVDQSRAVGLLGRKGTDNVKGDNWMRSGGVRGGRVFLGPLSIITTISGAVADFVESRRSCPEVSPGVPGCI